MRGLPGGGPIGETDAVHDVIIVGAGAAGLWAAAVAARRGRDVLLLEKTGRVGTKILASGGSRCNLTTSLSPEAAAAEFGHEGHRFLRTAFRELPPAAVRERFQAWGVPTTVEPEFEKVFPSSGRATDVRDALLRAATEAGATIRVGVPVEAIEPVTKSNGEAAAWSVRVPGETLQTRHLMLCPGGRSYPKTGTTGDGYHWLRSLELPVVDPAPALVPLLSPAAWARELAGISLAHVVVRLVTTRGKAVAERRRPLLFTHRGVSGPGPMDLSEAVARSEQVGDRHRYALAIDLCPDETWDDVRSLLTEAARSSPASSVQRHLPVELPQRARAAFLQHLGWHDRTPRIGDVSRKDRHRLVSALKGWTLPVIGTRGWDHAEVTAGGLSLDALDPGSMRVRGRDGLYVFGEIVDLQGPIGGFNFQAAFACAEIAARAV